MRGTRVDATSGPRSRHHCSRITLTVMSYALALTLFAFFSKGETARSLDDVITKTTLEPSFMGRFHRNLRCHPLPHACFGGLTLFQAISHWLLASKYSLDLFERSLYKQTLSHSPLQKREKTEKGCFPFV